MPQSIGWLAENQVMIGKYWDVVTLDDVANLLNDSRELYDNSIGLIDVISDFGGVTKIEYTFQSFIEAPAFKEWMRDYQDRVGWTIFVGPKDNVYWNFHAGAIMSKSNLRNRWFATIDEALTFSKSYGTLMNRSEQLKD